MVPGCHTRSQAANAPFNAASIPSAPTNPNTMASAPPGAAITAASRAVTAANVATVAAIAAHSGAGASHWRQNLATTSRVTATMTPPRGPALRASGASNGARNTSTNTTGVRTKPRLPTSEYPSG
jgi:hypothetical protein